MKQGKKLAGVILVVLFAYIYAHVAKTNIIYDKQVDSSQYVSIGVPAMSVEQEFVCVEHTLDAIQIKCQVYGMAEGAAVNLALQDCETQQVVAQADINVSDIKNGKFNTFSFETIQECKDKKYKVSLSNKGNVSIAGAGVGFVSQAKTEKDTKLIVDGAEREGTLIMKMVTNRFDVETFFVLLFMILYIAVFFDFLGKLFSR